MLHTVVVSLPEIPLLFNILLCSKARVQFQNCTLEFNSHLLVLHERALELVDLNLISVPVLLKCDSELSDFRVFLLSHLLHRPGKSVQIELVSGVEARYLCLELPVTVSCVFLNAF